MNLPSNKRAEPDWLRLVPQARPTLPAHVVSGLALRVASLLVVLAWLGCPLETPKHPADRDPSSAALDITITEGGARPLSLDLGGPFFIESFTVQARVEDYPDTDLMQWLATQSDFATLDWHGVEVLRNHWEAEQGGASEQRFYGGAAWMADKHAFSFEFVDENLNLVAGPFDYSSDDYIIVRRHGMAWNQSPVLGGYGGQTGDYTDLVVASGGSFSGEHDDIYVIEVDTPGLTDGSALVSVRSVRGDDLADPQPVINHAAIPLGAHGAQLVFSASPAHVHLAAQDRWLVRCTTARGEEEPAAVGPATPGPAASFNALAEVRLMVARDSIGAFDLPETTRGLRVRWSSRDLPYFIPLEPAEPAEVGYGLSLDFRLSPPLNQAFYQAGETIQVSLDLQDGAGNPLHTPGVLPSYREMLQHRANGIRYYTSTPFSCAPFFAECGLTFLRTGVWGPLHRIRQNYTVEHPHDWFAWENNMPEMGIIFGGYANQALWDLPISSSAELEIPQDAFPGTYIAVAKASRRYRGETVHRMELLRFQVKSREQTDFIQDVGNCRICHVHDARLQKLRHGTDDWRVCKLCHVPPHAGTDGQVVHEAHYFSQNVPPQRNDCTWCHLTPESNSRVSPALCGACHDAIHPGEHAEAEPDPYDRCAETCHAEPPNGHVQFPPQ